MKQATQKLRLELITKPCLMIVCKNDPKSIVETTGSFMVHQLERTCLSVVSMSLGSGTCDWSHNLSKGLF